MLLALRLLLARLEDAVGRGVGGRDHGRDQAAGACERNRQREDLHCLSPLDL